MGEETDLGFLDFGGTKRHPRGTEQKAVVANENAPDLNGRGHSVLLEHETRFELATLTLATLSAFPIDFAETVGVAAT